MENKIEFNLEKYNSGEYDVVTREGLSVHIAGVNKQANKYCKVVGWIDKEIYAWMLNGKDFEGGKSGYDLFLIPKKKIIKGWANVYSGGTYLLNLYETKEEAIERQDKGAIGIVYIETELIPIK